MRKVKRVTRSMRERNKKLRKGMQAKLLLEATHFFAKFIWIDIDKYKIVYIYIRLYMSTSLKEDS